MRKKLSAFLVAFVACLGLALAGGVYLTTSREMAAAIARIKQGTAAALLENFRYFDLLLWQAERGFDQHLEEALPALARRILDGERPLAAYSAQELKELAQAEGLDDLYLLDAEGEVVASSFPPDLGLNLREAPRPCVFNWGRWPARAGSSSNGPASPSAPASCASTPTSVRWAAGRSWKPPWTWLRPWPGPLPPNTATSSWAASRADRGQQPLRHPVGHLQIQPVGAWSIIHPGQPMAPGRRRASTRRRHSSCTRAVGTWSIPAAPG